MLHEVVKQLTKDRNLRFRTFSPWNNAQRHTGLIKAITHVTDFEIAGPPFWARDFEAKDPLSLVIKKMEWKQGTSSGNNKAASRNE